jgi:hypothetical protein
MGNISVKRRLAGIAAGTLVVSAPLVSVPLLTAPARAASPLMCRAHMGDATPKQYTYDRVYVKSASFTKIRTVAHYKTTDTTKFGKTNSTGHGSTNYYISSATAGYRVWVDVWLTKGGRHGHCRTSFVPHP